MRHDSPESLAGTSRETDVSLTGELIIRPLSGLKRLEFFSSHMPGARRTTKPNTGVLRVNVSEITQPRFSAIVCHQIYMKDLVPYLTRHDNLTWCFPLW